MPDPVTSPAPPADWLTPLRCAALLALLLFAAWPQVFLGAGTFVYRDFGYFTYPVAQFQRDCFWHGEFPLWNPENCCGIPFLAQWNTAALYPPSVFYLLLPLSWALGVFQLLHLLLGGVGMFFLARRWTGNSLAAAFAGVVFAFNGLSGNCLMWVSNLAALMWLPWLLWLAERAARKGGKMIVAAALVGALQMLAGSPEIILFTWLLLVPVVVGAGGMACLRLTVVALIVAGLAAAQLLPFLDLLAHSQRDEHFATGLWALPLHGWANFFAPLFHTHPSYHGVFAPAGQGWTSSYYVGLTTLALAALAVARVRSARVWWLALAAAGGLALAFGDAAGIYGWARHHLPGLGWMRYPVKFIVLPVVALPLLAAFALAEKPADAGKKLPRRLMILWLAVAAIVAAILWFAHQHPLPDDVWPATLHNGLARIAWLAATLAVIYFATKIQRPSLRALAQAALLLLVWLDLQTHTPRQQTVARDIYEPDLPRSLAAPHFGEGRVMTAPAAAAELNHSFIADPAKDYVSRRWTLLQNCNLLEAAPKVDGFFSLHVREEIEAGALLLGDTNGYPAPLADFLGVKLVTAPTNLFDWTPRATALLLVTTGQKPVFADAATTLARLAAPDFQPAAEVFLPPEARSLISATNLTLAKISNAKFAAQKITFETEASGPALVVVAQSYYHWWRAEVDGQPARLWRANHAYQALEVPAGRHRVTFVYADSSFRIGAAISLATLLGCGVAVIRRRKFFDLG